MNSDDLVRVRHMLDAAKTAAVVRAIEIIGEAVSRILKIDPDVNITDARRIVDLRNFVIHGYDRVDDVVIWGIISKDIPRLKSQVDKLL